MIAFIALWKNKKQIRLSDSYVNEGFKPTTFHFSFLLFYGREERLAAAQAHGGSLKRLQNHIWTYLKPFELRWAVADGPGDLNKAGSRRPGRAARVLWGRLMGWGRKREREKKREICFHWKRMKGYLKKKKRKKIGMGSGSESSLKENGMISQRENDDDDDEGKLSRVWTNYERWKIILYITAILLKIIWWTCIELKEIINHETMKLNNC